VNASVRREDSRRGTRTAQRPVERSTVVVDAHHEDSLKISPRSPPKVHIATGAA